VPVEDLAGTTVESFVLSERILVVATQHSSSGVAVQSSGRCHVEDAMLVAMLFLRGML